MSLDPQDLSDNLWTSYQTLIENGMTKQSDWINVWADNYDTYARAGYGEIMTTATSDKSIIVSYLTNFADNWSYTDYMVPVKWLAEMFVNYWATVQLNPNTEDSDCVSISGNNSSDYLSEFEQAIINSYRTTYDNDHYYHFFVRIQNVVEQITWTGEDAEGNTLTAQMT